MTTDEIVWQAAALYLAVGCCVALISAALWIYHKHESTWLTNTFHVLFIVIWPYVMFGDLDKLEKMINHSKEKDEEKRR